jgi:hypothetical protein
MPLTSSGLQIAQAQRGVRSRRQLLGCAVTKGELRWNLGRKWRLLLPGVVLLAPGLPSPEQRLVAALLLAGEGSWLAGRTAAALHGIPGCEVDRPLHVLVPAPRRSRTVDWVDIRATTLLDERLIDRGPLRVSSAARAVIDGAARASSEPEARALIIGAVQGRLVRLDDLAHWINARGTRGAARLRAALSEAAAGAWSAPEADLLRLIGTSDILPPPWPNPQLTDEQDRRLTTPDAWFDDVGLAVMVHSRKFHEDVLDWEATVEADADLTAAGVPVIGVTPQSIGRRPAAVLARVEAAWCSAAQKPRPIVRATPQADWFSTGG